MGAHDLLDHLHAAGLHLALSDDKIVVTPRAKLTDDLRQAIKANRADLVLALAPTRRSGNLLMSAQQAHDCHAGAWDDAEISAFTTRVMLFMRRRIRADAADEVAERLTLRDREHDDRRMCVECGELARDGRCQAAERGVLQGADRRLEPMQKQLVRCPKFGLRKGLA